MQRPPGRQEVPLAPVTLEDVVQTDVVTASPDTPVRAITTEMRDQDVGSVVVTEGDEVVGVVSDRRIALQLDSTPDLASQEVRTLVDRDATTATASMTVFEALQVMNDETIRRLPVVDSEGTLQGIVTLDDVLVMLGTELGNAVEIIEAQSPRL